MLETRLDNDQGMLRSLSPSVGVQVSKPEACCTSSVIRRTVTVGVNVDAVGSLNAVFNLIVDALEQRQTFLVTFVNPASAVLGRRKPELLSIFPQFDVVAPDGIGMVMAMRIMHAKYPAVRVSFDSTSLAPLVFQLAVARKISVALVGGAPGIAEVARNRILESYPGIQIVGVFDGFASQDETADAVMRLAPDIVVAGMGSLAQEKFLLKLVAGGWTGLGFTCGGYLDQTARQGRHYYPFWVDKFELRWAYRLMMEPRRLWRRYLLQYPEFGFRLLSDFCLQKKSSF